MFRWKIFLSVDLLWIVGVTDEVCVRFCLLKTLYFMNLKTKNYANKQILRKHLTKLFVYCRLINVGVDDAEGTPVTIPNTVVKLGSAEDT